MILGCEGLADYHCGLQGLEVPVGSSGTQLHHSACSFAAHVGSKCGGRWKSGPTLSSEARLDFSDNALVNSPENNEVIGCGSGSCIDTEGIALYIDLPCSPCEDSDSSEEFADIISHENVLAVGPAKGGIAGPALLTGSHEQLKMTSQAEVSQSSESKISSNLSSHVLRAFLEIDNLPRFKRWGAVTSIDQSPGSASYMFKKSELLRRLRMPTSPVGEGLVESVPGGRVLKEGLAGSRGESPCLVLEKAESKTPLSLGTHALRALMEADDVHKLKRRRLTTPTLTDSHLVKNSKDIPDFNSPGFVGRKPTELLVPKEIEFPEESSPSPDSDCLLLIRSSAESDTAEDATEIGGSGDSTSEMTSSGKAKSGSQSDSTSGSQENSPLDKYISRPPRLSVAATDATCPKKKEWLGGQHHGDNGKEATALAQDVGFAGNVGRCYRSAIDKRPAAPHPGFVGDGATVQFCRICGGREGSSSLICDSCDEVFHMACVNARMKIVPRVDEWLCKACKKKRKMSRENEQGDSDHGRETKDWWREDSGIGRVERELLRMSNGRRLKVRIGPKYQAEVPEWTGVVDEVDLDDNLAEASYRFGQEVAQTSKQKQLEQALAENNLANNLWPRGWLPASQLPSGSKENWIQCTVVLFDEGEIYPDGRRAERDIICGKWRRAPLGIVPNDEWECSCALVWDPRHADCAVPQELSTEEITERMKSTNLTTQQDPIYV